MSYQVLARRWRPQDFSGVTGQGHVSKTLLSAVAQGKVAHAYLFSGARGVGKTTIARILAKAVNCSQRKGGEPCNQCPSCQEIGEGRSVNVVEIDGASNTGVDDIRELREMIRYLPMKGEYKVYIIDEVHMLSNAAFNALLKTLEEPPPHLVFIFATTEVHKIPQTILSRCQHFAFRKMSRGEIVGRLIQIAGHDGFPLSERSAALIAKAAEGSMRDALSLLDQALAFGGGAVHEEELVLLLGRVSEGRLLTLSRALRLQNAKEVLTELREVIEQGYDLRQFCVDWLEHLRHLAILKIVPSEALVHVDLAAEDLKELSEETGRFELDHLQRLFRLFSRTLEEVKGGVTPQLVVEMAFLKALRVPQLVPLDEIVSKLEGFEKKLDESGDFDGPSAAARPVFQQKEREAEESRPSEASPANLPVSKPSEARNDPPSSSASMGDWPEILRQIKERKPNLGSYLEEGVLLGIDQKGVSLGYPNSSVFLIPLIQKEEHLKLISVLLSSRYGSTIPFRVGPLPPGLEQRAGAGLEGAKQLEGEAAEHPMVLEALRIFGGKVTEVQQE